jgi:hypothetical protein
MLGEVARSRGVCRAGRVLQQSHDIDLGCPQPAGLARIEDWRSEYRHRLLDENPMAQIG